jgi:hypothetical protein
MSELITDKLTTRDGSNVGAIVVADIDELLLLNTNKEINTTAIVKDNNRGGVFIYDGAQSGVNNGGTIFNGWVRQYDGAVNVKWFGAKGDGLPEDDDTIAFQAAIDFTSLSKSGVLDLVKGKTYIVNGLVPKDNVLINMNWATIKSINGANAPMFFDSATAIDKFNFGIVNGTLDGNKLNVTQQNVMGQIWLTRWKGLKFENLTIINGYRTGMNLIGVQDVEIVNYIYKDAGFVEATYYSYALSLEASGTIRSNNVTINNMEVIDCVGYGIHFFRCDNFVANNLAFTNLTFSTGSIGITFTEVVNGICKNVTCDNIAGDAIEINDSYNVELLNTKVNAAGNRALLVGQNTGGLPYNNKLKVDNFTSTNTVGANAVALSNCIESSFSNFNTDKRMYHDPAYSLSINNTINNCVMGATLASAFSLIYYKRFSVVDVSFSDYTHISYLGNKYTVSIPNKGYAIAEAKDLLLTEVGGLFMTTHGAVQGTCTIKSYFTSSVSQGSMQKFDFIANNTTPYVRLSTITTLSNSVNRSLTITADSANKKIVLTNGSSVAIGVTITLEFIV